MKEKKELIEQYKILSEAYIKLLNDKEIMLTWGKSKLEAIYYTKIGELQVQQLELQLKIKALKRQIEIVISKMNKNQPVNFKEIEKTITAQLAEAKKEIKEKTEQIQHAKLYLSLPGSPQKSYELTKTYRRLAKSLHPDLNPNFTEDQMSLWNKIQEAYRQGNLEHLKALEIIHRKKIEENKNIIENTDEKTLISRNKTLTEGINILETEIEKINKTFPFNIKYKLRNEKWIKEQQKTLQISINKLIKYKQKLDEKYTLIKECYE